MTKFIQRVINSKTLKALLIIAFIILGFHFIIRPYAVSYLLIRLIGIILVIEYLNEGVTFVKELLKK